MGQFRDKFLNPYKINLPPSHTLKLVGDYTKMTQNWDVTPSQILKMPDDRIAFRLGEIYEDLLKLAAFQPGKSEPAQASSIVCSQLMRREEQIKKRNEYLAWKRGITPRQLWLDILEGKAQKLSTDEMKELRVKGLIDESSADIPVGD